MKNNKIHKDMVRRWPGNPVIALDDFDFACSDVHNAGVTRYKGHYVLLVTVESLQGACALYQARSENGRQFQIEPEPFLAPAEEGPFARYETGGVRDARITFFEGAYHIVYVAASSYGLRLGLARTTDFNSVERIAFISEPDTKNGALFPRKIDGRYVRLVRPREGESIWLNYSSDLLYWGGWDVVMTPRGGYWDHHRIGAAAPPMETKYGWLLIYYAEKWTPSGPLFRLGAAILDREEPTILIGRTNIPILSPRERYERVGDVGNLVFSCGALLSEDGSEVEIYYGAADSCICLGTIGVEDIEKACICKKAAEG